MEAKPQIVTPAVMVNGLGGDNKNMTCKEWPVACTCEATIGLASNCSRAQQCMPVAQQALRERVQRLM